MGRRIHASEGLWWGTHTLCSAHHTSNMDRIFHSWAKVQSSSLTKRNRFSSGKNAQNTRRRLCFSALWWLCEPENNIYRASHLTSFITKSHTPASPMKLGVNPSSASLFSFSPSPRDPGLYLPSSHLHSRKGREKKNFGVIQQHWWQSATSKSPERG